MAINGHGINSEVIFFFRYLQALLMSLSGLLFELPSGVVCAPAYT